MMKVPYLSGSATTLQSDSRMPFLSVVVSNGSPKGEGSPSFGLPVRMCLRSAIAVFLQFSDGCLCVFKVGQRAGSIVILSVPASRCTRAGIFVDGANECFQCV